MPTETEQLKGRRITIDLTPAAAGEVDRLRESIGITIAELFRYALSLFRIYAEARAQGHELCIIDPRDKEVKTRIELPISVPSQRSGQWQTTSK